MRAAPDLHTKSPLSSAILLSGTYIFLYICKYICLSTEYLKEYMNWGQPPDLHTKAPLSFPKILTWYLWNLCVYLQNMYFNIYIFRAASSWNCSCPKIKALWDHLHSSKIDKCIERSESFELVAGRVPRSKLFTVDCALYSQI